MASCKHFERWSFYGHVYKGNVFIYVEDVKPSGKVESDGFKPEIVSGRWYAFGEDNGTGKYNEGTFSVEEFKSYEGLCTLIFDVHVPGEKEPEKYGFVTGGRVYNSAVVNALFNAYILNK